MDTQLTSLPCYNVVLTLRFGHENIVNNVVSMFSRKVFLMCTQRCQTMFHITFSQLLDVYTTLPNNVSHNLLTTILQHILKVLIIFI